MNEPIEVFAQNSIKLTGSCTIYIDPFQIPKDFHDADYVFITHPHWDHFSLMDILKVKQAKTRFFISKEIFEELLNIGIPEENLKVVMPKEEYHFEDMAFQTIPAYNLQKEFHPKEKNWCGYLITLDQVIYYIAGDTDNTEEAKEIKCDVAFLPVGGTYTMDERVAARLANIIHPHLAVPTHYLTVVGKLDNAKNFKKYLNEGIACKIFYKEKQNEE